MATGVYNIIIIVLCIAVLFISGIVLPKFFASQLFDIRLQLISHRNGSKISNSNEQSAPLVSVKESNYTNLNYESVYEKAHGNIASNMEMQKIKKRVKRQSSRKKSKELFNWNFNLNVTRHNIPESLDSTKKSDPPNEYLGMAIYMEGRNPNGNGELQNAWNSVRTFLKNVFGSEIESVQGEKIQHADDEHVDSISSSLRSNVGFNSTINSSVEQSDNEGSGEPSEVSRRRQGKFILEFFGFGGSSEKTDLSENTETDSISPNTSDVNNAFRHKVTDAIVSERTGDSQESQVTSASLNLSNFENGSNLKRELEFDSFKLDDTECSDCVMESPVDSENINTVKDLSEGVQRNLFSDEELEIYCMRLLNKLEESQNSLSDSDHDISRINFENHDSLSSENKVFNILSLMGTLEKKKSESDVIEDSFLVSDLDTSSIPSSQSKRQSRFFNFGLFGLGSGRSAPFDVENGELLPDEIKIEPEILPTISDCENYFRENIMFPRPNLMDILADPNIELADIVNATISPKLKEQQLQFLTDSLQTSLNTSFEKSDSSHTENAEEILSSKVNTSNDSNSSYSERESLKDMNVEEKMISLKSENESYISIQNATEIDRNGRFIGIFGSGDGSENRDSFRFLGSFGSMFGSGEGRLLNENAFNIESGSGEKFRENDFENYSQIFINPNTESNETIVPDGRFLNFFGLSSGDGRELTHDLIQTDSTPCENDCFDFNMTYLSHECNKCNLENPEQVAYTGYTDDPNSEHNCENDCSLILSENISKNLSGNESDWGSNFTSLNFRKNGENCSDCFNSENASHECLDDCNFDSNISQDFIDTAIETPEIVLAKFNFTDYENSTGCNDCIYESDFNNELQKSKIDSHETLLQELKNITSVYIDESKVASSIIPKVSFSKIETEVSDEISREPVGVTKHPQEHEPKTEMKTVSSARTLSGSGDGESKNLIEERTTVASLFSRKGRGRVLEHVDPCDDCDTDINDLLGENKPNTSKDDSQIFNKRNLDGHAFIPPSRTHSENFTELVIDLKSKVSDKNIISSEGSLSREPTKVTERFCHSASECNSILNERCIRRGSSSICGCTDVFIKQRKSGKCILKAELGISLKLPAEEFNQDLKNPKSPQFKSMEDKSLQTIKMLLDYVPELIPTIAGVEVSGFSAGSLVVSWNLVLAAENNSVSELAKEVKNDLIKALKDESVIHMTPLDISNASLLSVSSLLDPCSRMDLNYCSKNAVCNKNNSFPGGFFCHCKENYVDVSSNKMYRGEQCEAVCPSDFCGEYGHCELVHNERRCMCSQWYFGDRCEISGVVVIATFSANIFLIIAVILIVVICKARYRRTRSYGSNAVQQRSEDTGAPIIAVGGRASDVIALEENIGGRSEKFHSICTPIQTPTIRIIRPTVSESSFYDSSFDVTPTDS